jgi:hypothetical protein
LTLIIRRNSNSKIRKASSRSLHSIIGENNQPIPISARARMLGIMLKYIQLKLNNIKKKFKTKMKLRKEKLEIRDGSKIITNMKRIKSTPKGSLKITNGLSPITTRRRTASISS